jgi:two-component system, OmpR family, sensor histidine kinase MtrB
LPHTRRLGLRTRVAIGSTLIATVIAIALAIVVYVSVRSYLLEQRESVIRREAYANASVVAEVIGADPSRAATLVLSLRSEPGSVAMLRMNGEWLLSSIGQGPESLPTAVRERLDAGEPTTMRYTAGGSPRAVVAIPITGGVLDYVEVFPMESLASTLDRLRIILVVGSAAVALSGAVLGIGITRRALRPLGAAGVAAERLAGGQFGARVPPDRDPDLNRLAVAFNDMADKLTERIERERRFVSDVSHELRTPVATIRAATDVLGRRRGELSERGQYALDLLSSEVDEFDQLVVDLLEISRLESSGELPVAADDVVLPDVLRRVSRQHGYPDVPINIAWDRLASPIRTDKRHLERVIGNFIRNAHVHAGGPIEVWAARGAPGLVEIGVDDAGPGVPEDLRARIFERFARGDDARQRPGSGLGMSIAAEHARMLGGSIRVDDRPDGGARFVLQLPIVHGAGIEVQP